MITHNKDNLKLPKCKNKNKNKINYENYYILINLEKVIKFFHYTNHVKCTGTFYVLFITMKSML